MESRRWLEEQLFSRNGSKLVIVTHHSAIHDDVLPLRLRRSLAKFGHDVSVVVESAV